MDFAWRCNRCCWFMSLVTGLLWLLAPLKCNLDGLVGNSLGWKAMAPELTLIFRNGFELRCNSCFGCGWRSLLFYSMCCKGSGNFLCYQWWITFRIFLGKFLARINLVLSFIRKVMVIVRSLNWRSWLLNARFHRVFLALFRNF